MRIIGLAGPAGSGKDTVARALCETQGFVQIAFADPMRDGIKAMFSLTDSHLNDREKKEAVIPHIGKSPREIMQSLGTEWGRHCVNPDLWTLITSKRIDRIKAASPCLHINGIVISDVRFENEAALVRNQDGEIWHIHRTTMTCTGLASNALQHVSEQGIEWDTTDRIIHNAGSIDDLYETVAQQFDEEKTS